MHARPQGFYASVAACCHLDLGWRYTWDVTARPSCFLAAAKPDRGPCPFPCELQPSGIPPANESWPEIRSASGLPAPCWKA